MCFNTVIFCIAKYLDDLSIVDITWGVMFLIPNAAIIIHRCFLQTGKFLQPSEPMVLMFGMVAMWAVRLSLHIGMRHKGEDYRYKEMKRRWAHCNKFGALVYSYLFVFGMQGLFSMVNNAAALHVMRYSPLKAELGTVEIIGAIVWFIGFFMEVEADRELQNHRDDPSKKGKIIVSGIWRYSRHPNYFGECLSWWGIWIVACGTKNGGY